MIAGGGDRRTKGAAVRHAQREDACRPQPATGRGERRAGIGEWSNVFQMTTASMEPAAIAASGAVARSTRSPRPRQNATTSSPGSMPTASHPASTRGGEEAADEAADFGDPRRARREQRAQPRPLAAKLLELRFEQRRQPLGAIRVLGIGLHGVVRIGAPGAKHVSAAAAFDDGGHVVLGELGAIRQRPSLGALQPPSMEALEKALMDGDLAGAADRGRRLGSADGAPRQCPARVRLPDSRNLLPTHACSGAGPCVLGHAQAVEDVDDARDVAGDALGASARLAIARRARYERHHSTLDRDDDVVASTSAASVSRPHTSSRMRARRAVRSCTGISIVSG